MSASPYGDHWRNLRRISAIEIFSSGRLNTFTNTRKDEVKHLICKLAQNSVHEFAKVELNPMFSELTLNIIMTMVAGKRYYGDDVSVDKEEAKQFRQIMKDVSAHSGAANPADFLPLLNWVGGSYAYEKRVMKLAKKTDSFLQGLIDEQRSKGNTGTLIDHLLSVQDSQPDYYTGQLMKGFVPGGPNSWRSTSSVIFMFDMGMS